MKKISLSVIVSCLMMSDISFGQQCALDNPEYSTVISSVKALQDELNNIPSECKTSSVQTAVQNMNDLKDASSKLHSFWTTPPQVAGAVDPTQLSSSVTTAITSLNSVGEAIKSASKCNAVQPNSTIAIATKISDLVMNIAPLLIMASVFSPALPAVVGGVVRAIPLSKVLTVAVGASLTSTIAQIAADFLQNGKLNMDDPSHRRLVLKSLCEYSKIKKRVEYLSLINAGDITGLNNKYSDLKKEVEALKQKYKDNNPKLAELIDQYFKLRTQIKDEDLKINSARAKINQVKDQILSKTDKQVSCRLSNEFVKDQSLFSKLNFPITSSANYDEQRQSLIRFLLAYQETVHQNSSDVQKEFLAQNWEKCASFGKSWVENSEEILNYLSQFNYSNIQNLSQDMLNEPSFLQWRQESSSKEGDQQLLERIIGFVSASSRPSDILYQTDLVMEVNNLGKIILAQPDESFPYQNTIPYLKKKSLTGAWLLHRIQNYDKFSGDFTKEYTELNSNVNFLELDKYKQKEKDISGVDYNKKKKELFKRQNLEGITNTFVKDLGSVSLGNSLCQKLTYLKVLGNDSAKIMNSAMYLCKYLSDEALIDASTDSYVVEMCVGSNVLSVDNTDISGLAKRQAKSLAPRGVTFSLGFVQSRSNEIKCPALMAPIY